MDQLLTWLPVIMAIFAAGTAWEAHRLGSKRIMKDVSDMKERYDRYHQDHFAKTNELEVGLAQIGQAIHSHQEDDRDQFRRIEEWLKEQREDIKAILRLLPSLKQ